MTEEKLAEILNKSKPTRPVPLAMSAKSEEDQSQLAGTTAQPDVNKNTEKPPEPMHVMSTTAPAHFRPDSPRGMNAMDLDITRMESASKVCQDAGIAMTIYTY